MTREENTGGKILERLICHQSIIIVDFERYEIPDIVPLLGFSAIINLYEERGWFRKRKVPNLNIPPKVFDQIILGYKGDIVYEDEIYRHFFGDHVSYSLHATEQFIEAYKNPLVEIFLTEIENLSGREISSDKILSRQELKEKIASGRTKDYMLRLNDTGKEVNIWLGRWQDHANEGFTEIEVEIARFSYRGV